MAEKSYDIAIIGGGLAGLSLAILLGKQGWTVVCIDRETVDTQTDKNYDIRTTAISWGSRNLLKNIGVWADLESCATCIRNILIKDEDSPIDLEFNAAEIDAEGFGWIVDNRDLRQTLLNHVAKHKNNITHLIGQSVTAIDNQDHYVSVILSDKTSVNVRLIVGADGRNSFTRDAMNIAAYRKDYKQSAIVCLMKHTKPHNGLALEHFRAQGPFAVLPFMDDANGNHQSAIVWTVENDEADQWMICDDMIFNAAIQTRCGDLYGDVALVGTRAAWPLNLVKSYSYIAPRMVLVAEAAHGMHPIAGQGLNMSLRDIAALGEVLSNQQDPGDPAILKRYQKMRRADNFGMVAATDILNELFGSNISGVRAVRRFGLHAVSRLPFAKKFFMKQAMGAVGHLPQLIKDVG